MILTCVNHCPELVIALMTVFFSSGALVPVHAGQPDHSVSKRYSDGGYSYVFAFQLLRLD